MQASEANGIHHQVVGGIHSKDIIITSWAPDFSHGRESRIYCVLGFNLEEKTLGDRVTSWRAAVSADKRPVIMTKKPEVKEIYKIGLVKLEKPIQLDVEIGGYTFIKLPDVNREQEEHFATLRISVKSWFKEETPSPSTDQWKTKTPFGLAH
uniref:Uncharacterized protein n=1 Tax=Glossina austeni TaxID=7395 RepID=A0A1A9UII5_GLOAU